MGEYQYWFNFKVSGVSDCQDQPPMLKAENPNLCSTLSQISPRQIQPHCFEGWGAGEMMRGAFSSCICLWHVHMKTAFQSNEISLLFCCGAHRAVIIVRKVLYKSSVLVINSNKLCCSLHTIPSVNTEIMGPLSTQPSTTLPSCSRCV